MTEKLTFTQSQLNDRIAQELRKAREEMAAELEKAAEEGAARVPDYKALYEEAKAEREKVQAEIEAARAEQAAQDAADAKRRAIINRFFSSDNERRYRDNAEACEMVMKWFPDMDDFADEREAEAAAWDLKFSAGINIMEKIRKKADKKRTGGLFRTQKGAN